MSLWIPHPTSFSGERIALVPMEESHFPELELLASDKRIWEFYPYDFSDPQRFAGALRAALTERDKGTQYPFVIYHHQEQKLIGSTRFMDIQPAHRKLEIGSTWLHPDYWGTAINTECKLMLLSWCFEELGASRVFLKTDANNTRSRKAIEKTGGTFEGILRNDMIRDNGTKRNSAYYGFTEEEWNEKKKKLETILKEARERKG